MYWSEPLLQALQNELGLVCSHFDFCMYGLYAKHGALKGELLKKSWSLSTSKEAFAHHTLRLTRNVVYMGLDQRNAGRTK